MTTSTLSKAVLACTVVLFCGVLSAISIALLSKCQNEERERVQCLRSGCPSPEHFHPYYGGGLCQCLPGPSPLWKPQVTN